MAVRGLTSSSPAEQGVHAHCRIEPSCWVTSGQPQACRYGVSVQSRVRGVWTDWHRWDEGDEVERVRRETLQQNI